MVTYRPKPKPVFIVGDQPAKPGQLRIEDNMVVGTGDHYPDQCIKKAIDLITEARKYLTIWEFEQHIRSHVKELGGHGFLCSIGEAILNGATIDAGSV